MGPNDAHQEEANSNLSNSGSATRPDQIREEPRLISDPEASVSSTVEPGDDPLSQLAASSHTPALGEGLNDRIPTTLDHSLHNHEELLNSGNGRGRGGVAQYGRCLSEDDHRNLRNFVIDLVSKKLLPHLNEVLKNLNEWVSGPVHGIWAISFYSFFLPAPPPPPPLAVAESANCEA